MKHEPGKQYFISVVSLVTLESLAWTITGLLNGYDFVIILILIAGDLITAIIFFLPYLLWYNPEGKIPEADSFTSGHNHFSNYSL